MINPNAFSFDDLSSLCGELCDFVQNFQMGNFYRERIDLMICHPDTIHPSIMGGEPRHILDKKAAENLANYIALIESSRERVLELVVEMLRFQDWAAVANPAS